jgi:hypothetical protein
MYIDPTFFGAVKIFCFVRRRGISTGTGYYQIKWKIEKKITFFRSRKKDEFNEKNPTFSFSFFASFFGQITE